MLQRLSNPKSVFAWWLAIGLILGLVFSASINSFMVGIPMGVAFSLVIGKATSRVSQKLNRSAR